MQLLYNQIHKALLVGTFLISLYIVMIVSINSEIYKLLKKSPKERIISCCCCYCKVVVKSIKYHILSVLSVVLNCNDGSYEECCHDNML